MELDLSKIKSQQVELAVNNFSTVLQKHVDTPIAHKQLENDLLILRAVAKEFVEKRQEIKAPKEAQKQVESA